MAGTSPQSMLSAIILFFSSILIGITLGVFGGSVVDILDSQFHSLGWFQGCTWGEFAGYDFAINLFYFFPYIIPLLGLYILFSTIYHRHGRDREERDDGEDMGAYLIDRGRI